MPALYTSNGFKPIDAHQIPTLLTPDDIIIEINCSRTARDITINAGPFEIGKISTVYSYNVDSIIVGINRTELKNQLTKLFEITCPFCYEKIGIIILDHDLLAKPSPATQYWIRGFSISKIPLNYSIQDKGYDIFRTKFLYNSTSINPSHKDTHEIFELKFENGAIKRIPCDIIRRNHPPAALELLYRDLMAKALNQESLILFKRGNELNNYNSLLKTLNYFKINPMASIGDFVSYQKSINIHEFVSSVKDSLTLLENQGYIQLIGKKGLLSRSENLKVSLTDKGSSLLKNEEHILLPVDKSEIQEFFLQDKLIGEPDTQKHRKCNNCGYSWILITSNEKNIVNKLITSRKNDEINKLKNELLEFRRCAKCGCWGYKEEIAKIDSKING